MTSTIDVRVPDIGDFADVPIIEVLVKPGDRVEVETPLVTLESEKASMEVPSPSAGIVESVAVKLGDRVSAGSALVTLAPNDAGAGKNGAGKATSVSPEDPAPAVAETPAATTNELFEVRVPDIGDFSDVPVIDVLVKPGERVDLEAPLVTLESEKASMDVPSPRAGVVRDVAVKVGDKISQGTLIVSLDVAGSTPAGATDAMTSAPASDGQPQPVAIAPAPDRAPNDGVVHASPSIRRFARELGVDLRLVGGTGPHGRITRDDVQSFVKSTLALGSARPTAAARDGAWFDLPPWPKVDFASFGPIERKPLSRIKRLAGPNLHRNWVMIPHVTNNDEADITDLESLRQKLNAEDPTAKLTILAFLIKAVVASLQRFPEFNAALDGDELVLRKYYNIGFAADTPNGLVVPVIRNADALGVLALASQTRALAARARDAKLTLAEMQGGTFTISSLGGIGGTSFSPIINAPEVAILGVSRSAMRPVWEGTTFVPRLMLPLSLSYDHRVIDGALAARFNAHLASLLADLRRAML